MQNATFGRFSSPQATFPATARTTSGPGFPANHVPPPTWQPEASDFASPDALPRNTGVLSWEALEPSVLVVSVTPSGLEEMFEELDALGSAQGDIANVRRVCAGYDIEFARR